MRASRRIIERSIGAVNGALSACPRRSASLAVVRVVSAGLVALAVLLPPSCAGREHRAERLYREAATSVDRGDLESAVDRYERIQREFPDTETARKSRGEAILYRGLLEASRRYPVRRAMDMMIQAARAVERYHDSRGSWPSGLGDVVPAFLAAEPADPWGRPLLYRAKVGGKGYVLTCLGADGASGGSGENSDLVIEDGSFVKGAAEAGL